MAQFKITLTYPHETHSFGMKTVDVKRPQIEIETPKQLPEEFYHELYSLVAKYTQQ